MPRLHRSLIAFLALIGIATLHYSDVAFPSPVEGEESQANDNTRNVRNPKFAGNFGLWGRPAPVSPAAKQERAAITVDRRGLAVYDTSTPLEDHPIELLIERGRRQAAAQQARRDEVESLDDSVDDYRAAFGMPPPRGFDAWFNFANSIKPASNSLPSLMPFVHDPFKVLLSHPASTMRERVEHMREGGARGIFTFTFVPEGQGDRGLACTTDQTWHPGDWHTRGKGRLIIRGDAAWSWRCNNTLELYLPMLPLMPEEMFTMDPPFEMAFSLGDGPRSVVHHNFKEKSETLAKAGKVWSKSDLAKAEHDMRWTHGWHWTCPEGSPVKVANTDLVLNDLDDASPDQTALGASSSQKSFIADSDAALDFCNNPALFPLHNLLLMDEHINMNPISPCVSTCKTSHNTDIAGVPLDAVWEQVDFTPWSGKTNSKAFWRGSTTGIYHNKRLPWRQSQRERLHFWVHNETDTPVPVLVDRSAQGLGVVSEQYSSQELRDKWLDVGLAGGPAQCDKTDGTCEEMANEINFLDRVRKEFGAQYKYVLDLDGNGWSSRFRRLLLGNNVVLKSTLFPEWFSEQLIPWYHYVPLKLDYSDLFDILAFFNGAPDGSTPGRDELAEEIAKNGVDFVNTRYRNHDMQSFMYLLTLEFWRLVQDDRKAFSYVA